MRYLNGLFDHGFPVEFFKQCLSLIASANLYSLIETAKANGLEPYAYLRRVFTDLPNIQGVEDIDKLLPWNIKDVVG